MNNKIDGLLNLLNYLPISKWGVGDITSLHTLAKEFPKVITLVFAYKLDFERYNESEFYNALIENKSIITETVKTIEKFLNENNIKYFIPDARKGDKNSNIPFSFKFAATRSGIGWIGKNTLLVTREYGPRFRMAVILVDLDLPVNQPVTESSCGECEVCINSCPHKCINNQKWSAGVEKGLLFDATKCKHTGHKFVNSIGREYSCGICAFLCPIGKLI
jgi:epoxyqueuosine reductase